MLKALYVVYIYVFTLAVPMMTTMTREIQGRSDEKVETYKKWRY